MDAAHGGQSPEDEGGAEHAFEALREEVAALRRGIEMLYRQVQQAGQPSAATPGPDYSLTLGKMEKALQAIAGRLEGVERQPALRLTPASFKAELDTTAQDAAIAVSRPFLGVTNDVRAAASTLETLIRRIHERREQQLWLWTVGGCGVLGGVLLWVMLAAFLPWGAGNWLAALPLGGEWQGGQVLLKEAGPATWDRMVRLNNACPADSTTALCEAVLAMRTLSPTTQEETKVPATVAPARPSPRSRTGQPVQ
jgi:hypothetical protein